MSDDDWLTDRRQPDVANKSRSGNGPLLERPSAAASQANAPKVLLRPKDAPGNEVEVERPAPKTLKQKEAEYAAARARIFGENGSGRGGGGRGGRGTGGQGARGVGARGAGAGAPDYGPSGGGYSSYGSSGGGSSRNGGERQARRRPNDNGMGDPDYARSGGARRIPNDNGMGDPDYARSGGVRRVPNDNGMGDPDYDRNRVVMRTHPGDSSDESLSPRDTYDRRDYDRRRPAPAPIYETEFPALGG